MNGNWWDNIQQQRSKLSADLDRELKLHLDKMEQIRSESPLLSICKLNIVSNGQKKTINSAANLTIGVNHELVVRAFDEKELPLIVKTIVDSKLGYEQINRNKNKNEAFFVPKIITREVRERMIQNVRKIAEEGKACLRKFREKWRSQIKKDSRLSENQKKICETQIETLINEKQKTIAVVEQKKIQSLN